MKHLSPSHTRRLLATLACPLLLSLALHGCGGSSGAGSSATPSGSNEPLKVVEVADGLDSPWGLAFLPSGDMLVTEKAGTMRVVSADGRAISNPITGVPAVVNRGQGGLLDVAVDPDFSAANPWVYWSYAEEGTGAEAGRTGTAVARGRLVGNALQNVAVIFRQSPKVGGDNHFGSRLVFATDKSLFITLGERMADDPSAPGTANAQNVESQLGKVVRINRDGSDYAGNPNWGATAKKHLWSIGHRNPQGAALHPTTGELWVAEHGPRGGDEINIARAGKNYGWPLRSYGCPYSFSAASDACRVGGGTHAPAFEEPLTYWVPTSIAPSGIAFYTGTKHANWQGNLFVGALANQSLWRLTLSGNTVTAREELFKGVYGRIRDVQQGPDGWLYLLTDGGEILRVER